MQRATALLRLNGIDLSVTEQGAGMPVVFCHGFPGLSYSWRHQLPVLADAGWRAIAPDMRGYGRSDHPADPAAYDRATTVADLVALLDELGLERAVFAGHDFGANLVWALARQVGADGACVDVAAPQARTLCTRQYPDATGLRSRGSEPRAGSHTSVDDVLASGAIARFVTGEEDHEVGDLGRRAVTWNGQLRHDMVLVDGVIC